MRWFSFSVLIVSLALLGACSDPEPAAPAATRVAKKQVESPKKQEPTLPEGYPIELTLPPGYKPSDVKTGSGSVTGGGQGKRTYKKYEIWKMMPKMAPVIYGHYRNLLSVLHYAGEWKGGDATDDAAYGVFTKDNQQLELSISKEKFSFILKVFDACLQLCNSVVLCTVRHGSIEKAISKSSAAAAAPTASKSQSQRSCGISRSVSVAISHSTSCHRALSNRSCSVISRHNYFLSFKHVRIRLLDFF